VFKGVVKKRLRWLKALQHIAEPGLPLRDREKSVREVLLFSGMEAK